jgi:hypothetical protein
MPFCTLIAAQPGVPILAQLRCPIDDEHSFLFRVIASPDRPITDEERASYAAGVFVPEMIPGTDRMRESMANDYLIDRETQKSRLPASSRSSRKILRFPKTSADRSPTAATKCSRAPIARSSRCANGCSPACAI